MSARALSLHPNDIVVTGGNHDVLKIDPVTGEASLIGTVGGLSSLTGVAVTPTGDVLAVDSGVNTGVGRVIRIDPATGSQETLSEGGLLEIPRDITLTPNGDILVLDPGARAIIEIDRNTGVQTLVAASGYLNCSYGIAANGSGQAFVATTATSASCPAGDLVAVDLLSGEVSRLATSLESAWDVTVDPAGNLFLLGLLGDGKIALVDPETGDLSLAAEITSYALRIAAGVEGEIFFTLAAAQGVGAVDLDTGDQWTIASGLDTIRGLAVVPIPEPATGAYVGLGLVMLAGYLRTRADRR